MKKQISLLLFSILTLLLLNSCRQETVKTEEKVLVQKYYLTADTSQGALSVDIHVEFPVAYSDADVLSKIRTSIITSLFEGKYDKFDNDSLLNAFVLDLYADYKANNESLVEKLDKETSYLFNVEHTVEGFTLLSDKQIYSYGIDRFVYMGGAHGLSTRNYLNFDLKTGNEITENDLFKEGTEEALADLFRKRIVEQSNENEDISPILKLEDTDFWVDSIKPNGNFYITDESINYVFNPYEIGPYYIGQTEINLPFERIKAFLKPNSIIAYLLEKQPKKE